MSTEDELNRLRAVKAKYEQKLLKLPNVVGIGIGFREIGDQVTDQPAIIVLVSQKVPSERLHRRDRIPRELDGLPVDVKQVGAFRAEEG